uniref:TIMELESS-interacting protein n=1 Tax=Astyanax mexicanus TaxID=7994 RepID=A0A3B1IGW5_ASTMX
MCSSPDDYHITVPPSYENLDDEIYQPFPPPLSPTCAHLSETSNKSGEQEQKIGGLLLSQMEEEPVMQMDMPHTALNVDRLVSEKGIPALWDVLNNTSFKGQGHEEEDLQILMSEIEQWGQQLYPEEPFETFINQLEDVSDHPSIQVLFFSYYQNLCECVSGCYIFCPTEFYFTSAFICSATLSHFFVFT